MRLLRVRKWLYLSSGIILVLDYGLYSAQALATAFPAVQFPGWLISQAAFAGLAYLLALYALLSHQLWKTYDIVLDERLTFRRLEEFEQARSRIVKAVENEVARRRSIESNLVDSLSRQTDEIAEVSRILDDIERGREGVILEAEERLGSSRPILPSQLESHPVLQTKLLDFDQRKVANIDKLARLKVGVDEAHRALAEVRFPENPGSPFSDSPEVQEAQRAFDDLARKDPASRKGYRRNEIAIDIIRVCVPAVAALFATARYLL